MLKVVALGIPSDAEAYSLLSCFTTCETASPPYSALAEHGSKHSVDQI